MDLIDKQGNSVSNLKVLAGQVKDCSIINKFGENPDVDTGSIEDIWAYGGTYTLFTTAVKLGFSSGSAVDTSAGTGARTIRIYGLDADYNQITEDVILNGQTKVETTLLYLRHFRAKVLTAGSGMTNAGIIYGYDTSDTVTAGVPQTATKVQSTISIGEGQTLQCIYTVPLGYDGYLFGYIAALGKLTGATNRESNIYLKLREYGSVFQTKRVFGLHSTGGSIGPGNEISGLYLPPKSDIKMSADSTENNSDVSAWMDIELIKRI